MVLSPTYHRHFECRRHLFLHYRNRHYGNGRYDKGENKIDIIAEDELDNKIEFIEVKRQIRIILNNQQVLLKDTILFTKDYL